MASSIFTECFGPSDGQQQQVGCGLGSIGDYQPLINEFKRSLLDASQSVLKKLRHRQVGKGVKKSKRKQTQKGGGAKKKKKNQRGKGRPSKSKK
jgi:hypothetical protein